VIIPSIDLQDGQTVQLVQGQRKALDAGDPRPLARQFGIVGEVAVIDLDSAMGRGSNESLIRDLLPIAPVRVGGGIRDAATAIRWLDAGAQRVILGTAANPEILSELPKQRVIAAVDGRDGQVVVEGWQRRAGVPMLQRIRELRPYVGGFLVTFVETEGTLSGINLDRAKAVIEAAGDVRVTLAGGIRTAEEVAELDRLGADAQVGMAIYTGKFDLADALIAMLTSDRSDGLWPTVVVDERGAALGLVYSSPESLKAALVEQRGVYHSRSRRGLWRKGETSGNRQDLLRVELDCDRDALRFTVRQSGGGFCHTGARTCWGDEHSIASLARRLIRSVDDARRGAGDLKSYTARLVNDTALLASKLREEAIELSEARDPAHVALEAADVLYFTLVKLAADGVPLEAVETELARRSLKVTRRPGNAKPEAPR
jgi:phosphoribosyl-ATP pyrophosphohydrolase